MRRALLHFQRYKSVPIRVLAGPDRREVAPAEFFDHSVSSVKHVADPHGMVAARPITLRALAIQLRDVAPRRRRRRRRRVVVVVGIIQIVPRIDVVLGRVGDGLGRLLRLLARWRLGGRGLSIFASAAFPRHLSVCLARGLALSIWRQRWLRRVADRTSGLTVLAVSSVGSATAKLPPRPLWRERA